MLAGLFQGIAHDRKLMREAQVNLAIRWFIGYRLNDTVQVVLDVSGSDKRLPRVQTSAAMLQRDGVGPDGGHR